jgi:DNA-binding NarL/FixJ family response regulator
MNRSKPLHGALARGRVEAVEGGKSAPASEAAVRARVLIADDHPLMLRSLRSLMERARLDVVAEAADGAAAVRLAIQERPDIALLDLVMPRGGGLEATRRILHACPGTRVVILSGFVGAEEVAASQRAGAAEFIPKTASPREIIATLRALHARAEPLATSFERRVEDGSGAPDACGLSRREREVLRMVAQGYTSGGAAAILGVSSRTVESHRQQVMNKLGIHSVAGLTRFAIARGLG